MGVRPYGAANLMWHVRVSYDGDAWGTVQEWRFAVAALLHFGYSAHVDDYHPAPMWSGLGDVLADPSEDTVRLLYGQVGMRNVDQDWIAPTGTIVRLTYLLKIMDRAAAILKAQGKDY